LRKEFDASLHERLPGPEAGRLRDSTDTSGIWTSLIITRNGRMFIEQYESLSATFRLKDAVSGGNQGVLYDQAHTLVIVNDEQLRPHGEDRANPWPQMCLWVQVPIDAPPPQQILGS
jgi:hypothetical protein